VKSVTVNSNGATESSLELVKMGQGDGKLAISVTPKNTGTVSIDPNQAVYPAGTNVILTAEAILGYKFKVWTGAATGTKKRTSVAAVGKTEAAAVFEKTDDLTMVSVEGGTFTMGCTPEQGVDCDSDERPAHSVTVSDFYIGKFEVTQRLWTRIMDNNPSGFKGDDLPVENVSWNDIQEFIKKLNEQTGKKYRLPTEAEWEYAARGGNKSNGYKYSGSSNIDDVAWYSGNGSNKTNEVGTKSPNELGVYDMTGNVLEWVNDWGDGMYTTEAKTNPQGPSSGSERMVRGGSWRYNANKCRITCRLSGNSDLRINFLGFRLALSSVEGNKHVAESNVVTESNEQAVENNERFVGTWISDGFWYDFTSDGKFSDGIDCESDNAGTYKISDSTLIITVSTGHVTKVGFKFSDDGKTLVLNFNSGAYTFKYSKNHPCT
jgi:formylglycine-generating enzyme required for sulfatase activity